MSIGCRPAALVQLPLGRKEPIRKLNLQELQLENKEFVQVLPSPELGKDP